MADIATGEGFLLAILNSTPVVDGVPADEFADPARALVWLTSAGGLGTEAELRHVLEVRRLLQAVVRGELAPDALDPARPGRAHRGQPPAGAGGPPERASALPRYPGPRRWSATQAPWQDRRTRPPAPRRRPACC